MKVNFCAYCNKKIKKSQYADFTPFCSQRCGWAFARAAYRGGFRMVKQ